MSQGALPADWQAQMVEMIRGAAPAEPGWFQDGPNLSAAEQIAVYQQQYRLRIYDALVEDVPGTVHLLGARAEDVLWAYLHACPPRTWTLNAVHDRLPSWLAAQGAAPAEVEMAALEWAVAQVFEAADAEPLRPESLATLPTLRLAPAARLLTVHHTVHRLRSALLTGAPLPPLSEETCYLLIFRRDFGVRHRELEPEAWALLQGIAAGEPLTEVIPRVAASLPPAQIVERFSGKLAEWFRFFAEDRIVTLA